MTRLHRKFFSAIVLIAVLASGVVQAKPLSPIYVHMNGANMFLENVIAVEPGQPVVFVNEDAGVHTIIGYDPNTGKTSKTFNGFVAGTKGSGTPIATYTITFTNSGLEYYYCSVHALLVKEPLSQMVEPKIRPGVDGFGDPMAGLIIVTTDPTILAQDPPSSHQKILADYFGG
jgi:plastocyanin